MPSGEGPAFGPALHLRLALCPFAAALLIAGCGGGEPADPAPPGIVEGVDSDAAEQTVRNAFADPSLLCGQISTDNYVRELGGRSECLTSAGAVPGGARNEGDGYRIGSTDETPDGFSVTIETPDFGRYVYELVEEDDSLRIDSVDRQIPGSDAPEN